VSVSHTRVAAGGRCKWPNPNLSLYQPVIVGADTSGLQWVWQPSAIPSDAAPNEHSCLNYLHPTVGCAWLVLLRGALTKMQNSGTLDAGRPASAARRSRSTLAGSNAGPSSRPSDAGSPTGSRRSSHALSEDLDDSPFSQAVAAHKEVGELKLKKEMQAVVQMKSKTLSDFLAKAISGTMAQWSRSGKKSLFLAEINDTGRSSRAMIERSQLAISYALAIMNTACIALQCTSSRLQEGSRDAVVAKEQLSSITQCCIGFNLTLTNGVCGEDGSQAAASCIPDPTLIVSTDTEFVVAYGTSAFWTSFYLNAAVSILSALSICALFYHAHLSKKIFAFSKHLEQNKNIDTVDTKGATVYTFSFWFQIFLLCMHMPPLPFDIPVLQFNHPYYTDSKLLKFPWIAIASAVVTLRVIFVIQYVKDRNLILWSAKRRIVERQTGIKVDAVFVIKVLMSEAPMTVVCSACVGIFFILTYWMLVVERNNEWLRTFQDSLWLIVITAFTIGYGGPTFPNPPLSHAPKP